MNFSSLFRLMLAYGLTRTLGYVADPRPYQWSHFILDLIVALVFFIFCYKDPETTKKNKKKGPGQP